MKIEKDMKVFLRPTGNIARYNKDFSEGIVTKVARKYFYVSLSENHIEKFEIDTLKNIHGDYNSAYILYFSKQEILDEDEKNVLLGKFRALFDWMGKYKDLSLEQLREMAKIAELK